MPARRLSNEASEVASAMGERGIEDDPANPAYIRTQRGQGYLFVPQGKG